MGNSIEYLLSSPQSSLYDKRSRAGRVTENGGGTNGLYTVLSLPNLRRNGLYLSKIYHRTDPNHP